MPDKPLFSFGNLPPERGPHVRGTYPVADFLLGESALELGDP